jgi:hypothetical protein
MCENFLKGAQLWDIIRSLGFHEFYSIMSFCEVDFGAKIWNNYFNFGGARHHLFLMRILSARLSCVCSVHASVPYSRSFLFYVDYFYLLTVHLLCRNFPGNSCALSSATLPLLLIPTPYKLLGVFLHIAILRPEHVLEKSNPLLIICASCLNPRFFCLLSALCLQLQYLDWQTLNFFIQ